MTTYLEPYCVLSDDRRWWPGLILKSISERQEQVAIVIDNERGSTVRTIPVTLSPRQLLVLVADKLFGSVGPGRYSIVISHGPEVHHRLLQAGPVSFNYSTPVEIAAPLPAKPQTADLDHPVQFVDTAFARFNGQDACRLIKLRYYELLTRAAALLAVYADGRDPVVNFGDACPLSGNCEGHPGGAHGSHQSAIDIDYLTMTGGNTTQSRRQSGGSIDIIWDGDKLTDNFDWQRNYLFWRLIATMAPGARIAVHTKIYEYVQGQVAKIYGTPESGIFAKYMQADSVPEYNHDTHCHVRF